jgi:hypothetical protein
VEKVGVSLKREFNADKAVMILLLAILGITLYGTIGFLVPLFTRDVFILRYYIFTQFFGG